MRIFTFALSLMLLCLVGCKTKQANIHVLSSEPKQDVKQYVVNGGPGSTEVIYEDEKGQKMTATSNVVKIPIVDRCDPVTKPPEEKKEEIKEIPDEQLQPPIEEEYIKEKPEQMFVADLHTFPNHVVFAGYQIPQISYQSEVYIERKPPEIKLEKSSDEDRLCCDRQLTFRIKFTNMGGLDAQKVKIEDIVPAKVEYVEETAGAHPYSASVVIERDELKKAKKIVWNIEEPVLAGASGEVFYTVVCPPIRPKLLCYLRFEPKALHVGQEGSVICTVTNSGTGTAEGVNLDLAIPQGVEYQGQSIGKKETIPLGPIEAGKSASHTLKVRMRSGGRLDKIVANVAASNAEGCDCFVPPAPTLKIEKTGPEQIDNRLPIEYTIVVKNISQEKAPATNCVLIDQLPPFVSFKSASQEGVYSAAKHDVTWKLGTLEPGAIVARTVIVIPQKAGDFVDKAEVTCDEGITVNDQAKTTVRGITALEVSSYDTEDPVEVGSTTTYMIEILNEGFKDITGLKAITSIPVGSEFIEASVKNYNGSPIGHKVVENKVVFDEIPELPSGEKVLLRVTVRAKEKMELLSTTSINYNEFAKTIVVSEPTSTY